MRVIIYPRVSSKKQVDEGDSIDAQIKRLTDFCKDKGYEVYDVWTDAGKSASFDEDSLKQELTSDSFVNSFKLSKRPAFERLLRECKNGKFEGIVFFKWDRFSRDVAFADLATRYFTRYNIKLIPTDDSEDPFVSSLMGVINKQEIEKMKARVKQTRMLRFGKGMMVARPHVGYKIVNKKIVIDPKKVEMIKEIFNSKAKNQGYKDVCLKYNLDPKSYYNILHNKVYAGFVSFQGEIKKGSHEPIVSEELFNKCQK